MVKRKRSIDFKKYLAEGALIVFSVLFALFINRISENIKLENKKEIAKESIRKELIQNAAIIKNWQEKHKMILNRISSALEDENDSLKIKLQEFDYFNLGVLTNNESVINEVVTNTAWETTKSTELLSEFDFDISQNLTYVYKLQDVLTEKTMDKILDLYFDSNTQNMNNLDYTLIQFNLLFQEATGQENLLLGFYDKAISSLNKK